MDKAFEESLDKIEIKLEDMGLTDYKTYFKSDTCSLYAETLYLQGTDDALSAMRKMYSFDCLEKYNIDILNRGLKKYAAHDCSIIFFDEKEIGKEEARMLQAVRQEDVNMIPVILFPDEMQLPEGDDIGIPRIISSVEKYCTVPAVIFPYGEFAACGQNVVSFFKYIRYFVLCKNLYQNIKADMERLIYIIRELYEVFIDSKSNARIKLQLSIEMKGIYCYIVDFENLLKIIDNGINEMKRVLHGIQVEEKNKVCVKRFKLRGNIAEYTQDILLTYGTVIDQAKEVIKSIIENTVLGQSSMLRISAGECLQIFGSRNSMALIGTFSSGKTSFINWLLNMSEHKFKTSGGHNTALLTEIVNAADAAEAVDMVYKHNLSWELFSTDAYDNFAERYTGDNRVTVSRVDEKGGYIEVINDKKVKRRIPVTNGKAIIVQVGQRISKGDFLTQGYQTLLDVTDANFKLRPLEEYKLIIEAVKRKHLTDCKLEVQFFSDELKVISTQADVIGFLKKMYYFEKNTGETNIPGRNMPEKFFRDNSFGMGKKLAKAVFVAKCNMESKRILLERKGWEQFCSQKEDTAVFPEQPQCYLFVQKLIYNINNQFLQYTDIVDTPGLGSVSDEHDAITESYIRRHNGILLVMIRVDRRAFKREFILFINNLADIYERLDKDKSKVTFVCNCWIKQLGNNPESIRVIENYCSQIFALIEDRGFSTEKIFVIDMQAMQKGNSILTMFGKYKSDQLFRTSLVEDIEKEGVYSKLVEICKKLNSAFINSKNKLENDIRELDKEKHIRERVIDEHQTRIKRIKAINMDSFEKLFNTESVKAVTDLAAVSGKLIKKKNWEEEKQYFNDSVKMGEENSREDDIISNYNSCINKIYADDDYIDPAMRYENVKIGLIAFPWNKITKIYNDGLQGFKSKIHIFKNSAHSTEHRNKLTRFLEEELEEARKSNLENYNRLVKKLDVEKQNVIYQLNADIARLSNSGDRKNSITYAKTELAEIEKMNGLWKEVLGKMRRIGVEYNES